MAASIVSVLEEIQTRLLVLHPRLRFRLHDRERATKGVPPEVAWVVSTGAYGPPTKARNNPRQLFTHSRKVAAFAWGGDFEEAEQLANNVVACAYRAAWGSFMPEGSEVVQPDWLSNGFAIRLDLSFDAPVLEVAKTVVVPTNFQTTPGMAGDGVLEPGET